MEPRTASAGGKVDHDKLYGTLVQAIGAKLRRSIVERMSHDVVAVTAHSLIDRREFDRFAMIIDWDSATVTMPRHFLNIRYRGENSA
jgi:hypothetical protein